ncbi:MAG: hypothetical protein RJB01_1737 [Actinomycetota bacterium]|jgi:hypothetical protein
MAALAVRVNTEIGNEYVPNWSRMDGHPGPGCRRAGTGLPTVASEDISGEIRPSTNALQRQVTNR